MYRDFHKRQVLPHFHHCIAPYVKIGDDLMDPPVNPGTHSNPQLKRRRYAAGPQVNQGFWSRM